MSFRNKLILVFVSVGIAFYTIWGGCFRALLNSRLTMRAHKSAFLKAFYSIFKTIMLTNRILTKFVPALCADLAYGLDPYSSYLTADQVKDFQNKKQNTLVGIGAEFSQVSYLYVISVIKDSPADKAGLKSRRLC